jgi:hypothetical protein
MYEVDNNYSSVNRKVYFLTALNVTSRYEHDHYQRITNITVHATVDYFQQGLLYSNFA